MKEILKRRRLGRIRRRIVCAEEDGVSVHCTTREDKEDLLLIIVSMSMLSITNILYQVAVVFEMVAMRRVLRMADFHISTSF